MKNILTLFLILFLNIFGYGQTDIPIGAMRGELTNWSSVSAGVYNVDVNVQDYSGKVNGTFVTADSSWVLWQNCKRYVITNISCGGCYTLSGSINVEISDVDGNGMPSFDFVTVNEENSEGVSMFVANSTDREFQCMSLYYIDKLGAGGGIDLSTLPAGTSIDALEKITITDSTATFQSFIDQVRDSTIIGVQSYSDIANISTTLEPGARIKVRDTGAEYLVQSSSIPGYTGRGVIQVGSNYAILQPIHDKYNIAYFGCIGDTTTNNTTFLNDAFNFQQAVGGELYVPEGYYNAGSRDYSFTKDLKISGAGKKKAVFYDMGLLELDTCELDISGIGFTSSPSNYIFRYNPGSLGTDTTHYEIKIENCWFNNVERAFSLFKSGTDDYINIFSLILRNNDFDSVRVGSVMLRTYMDNADISGNTWRDVADGIGYNFCVSIGDDDNHISYNLRATNNSFYNIGQSAYVTDAESYYIILFYGNGSVFSNNTFTDCKRGIYCRGKNSTIENNIFQNENVSGRLSIICKGGGNYNVFNNVFSGDFISHTLFDSDPISLNIKGNTIIGTLDETDPVVTGPNVFEIISDVTNLTFQDNTILFTTGNTTPILNIAGAVQSAEILDNNISINDGYLMAINDASNGSIKISGNIINCKTFLFGKADLFEISNNTFYVRKSSALYFRFQSLATMKHVVTDNKFLKSPDETWTGTFISGNIRFDGDFESSIWERNYFQPAGTSPSYWFRNNNTGNLTLTQNKIDVQHLAYTSTYAEAGTSKTTLINNDITSSTGIAYLYYAIPDSTDKMDVLALDNYSSNGDSIILFRTTPPDYEFFRNVEFRPSESRKWSIPDVALTDINFTKVLYDADYVEDKIQINVQTVEEIMNLPATTPEYSRILVANTGAMFVVRDSADLKVSDSVSSFHGSLTSLWTYKSDTTAVVKLLNANSKYAFYEPVEGSISVSDLSRSSLSDYEKLQRAINYAFWTRQMYRDNLTGVNSDTVTLAMAGKVIIDTDLRLNDTILVRHGTILEGIGQSTAGRTYTPRLIFDLNDNTRNCIVLDEQGGTYHQGGAIKNLRIEASSAARSAIYLYRPQSVEVSNVLINGTASKFFKYGLITEGTVHQRIEHVRSSNTSEAGFFMPTRRTLLGTTLIFNDCSVTDSKYGVVVDSASINDIYFRRISIEVIDSSAMKISGTSNVAVGDLYTEDIGGTYVLELGINGSTPSATYAITNSSIVTNFPLSSGAGIYVDYARNVKIDASFINGKVVPIKTTSNTAVVNFTGTTATHTVVGTSQFGGAFDQVHKDTRLNTTGFSSASVGADGNYNIASRNMAILDQSAGSNSFDYFKFNNSTTISPRIRFKKSYGELASPTGIAINSVLGNIDFLGYVGSTGDWFNYGDIRGEAVSVVDATTGSLGKLILGASNSSLSAEDNPIVNIYGSTNSVRIGDGNNPSRKLQVVEEVSNGNTIRYPIRVSRYTSGTASNNIGVGIEFESENSAGAAIVAGSIDHKLTTATSGNVASDFIFNTMVSNTLSEAARIQSDGVLDAITGFQINNAATSGEYLRGNGTNFVSSAIQPEDVPSKSLDESYNASGTSPKITVDATGGLEFESTGTGHIVFDLQSSGDIQFQDAGSTFATFRDNGRIGVGTTNPLSPLHLTSATNTYQFVLEGTGTGAVSYLSQITSASNLVEFAGSQRLGGWKADGSFYAGGVTSNTFGNAPLSVIASTGFVGIGNTAPAVKLHSETTSGAQLRLGYNTSLYTDFQTNSVGGTEVYNSGTKVLDMNSSGLGDVDTRPTVMPSGAYGGTFNRVITGGVTPLTGAYSVWIADITTAGAGITFNLPAVAVSTNLYLDIVNIGASASNPLILEGTGSETIGGALNYSVESSRVNLRLFCDGNEWFILATN